MTEKEVLEIFVEVKAVIENSHIVYTSGRHGSAYLNKDALYPHTDATSRVTGLMAKSFATESIDVVIAPALGGIVLSQWIGYHLSKLKGKEILSVYAEKNTDGVFEIRRGYGELLRGKNVLVIEDVLTTGGSIRSVLEALKPFKANVIGVSTLCNRGKLSANDLQVPKLKSLIEVDFESWEAEDCPLCQKGVPVNTEVGKGKDFLK